MYMEVYIQYIQGIKEALLYSRTDLCLLQYHLLQLGLGKCGVREMWDYNTLYIKCVHFSVIRINHSSLSSSKTHNTSSTVKV